MNYPFRKKKVKLKINEVLIPVSEFHKLNLNETDILIIRSEQILKAETIEQSEEYFSKKFGCRVILFDSRYSLHGILSKE